MKQGIRTIASRSICSPFPEAADSAWAWSKYFLIPENKTHIYILMIFTQLGAVWTLSCYCDGNPDSHPEDAAIQNVRGRCDLWLWPGGPSTEKGYERYKSHNFVSYAIQMWCGIEPSSMLKALKECHFQIPSSIWTGSHWCHSVWCRAQYSVIRRKDRELHIPTLLYPSQLTIISYPLPSFLVIVWLVNVIQYLYIWKVNYGALAELYGRDFKSSWIKRFDIRL